MPDTRTPKKILFIWVVLSGALLVCAWIYGFLAFTHNVAQTEPAHPNQKTDAIVVLTGGRDRLATGFDLLEAGYAKKLFISGVYQGVEVQELLNMWKDSENKISCCIELGYSANNTIGNAAETKNWMEKEKFSSLRLVTANYHIPRARLEFEHAMPSIKIIYHPIIPHGFDIQSLEKNKHDMLLTLKEYNKFLISYLRFVVFATFNKR